MARKPLVLSCLLAGLIAAFMPGPSLAGVRTLRQASLPTTLWALDAGSSTLAELRPARAARLRERGINAVVLDRLRLSGNTVERASRRARHVGLRSLRPRAGGSRRAGCRKARPCVVLARTDADAVKLARRPGVRLVVLRLAGPEAVTRLPVGSLTGRVLALPILSAATAERADAWRDALELARASAHLDLGVSLRGPRRAAALATFLDLLAPPVPPPVPVPGPELFVSPSGSDAGSCAREAPCGSFARAYELARPGQIVELAAGAYPAQTLPAAPGKPPPAVVFRPAAGASVALTGPLTVFASNIDVEDVAAPILRASGGESQTYRGLDLDLFLIDGAHGVSLFGGDVGPSLNADSQIRSMNGQVPTGIVISGVTFHDARRTQAAAHVECLQVGSGIDVTISDNVFTGCAVHDIFIRSWGNVNGSPHPLRGFRIENNVFDAPTGGFYTLRLALMPGWPCEDFLLQGNLAFKNMFSDCEGNDVRFVDNVQPSMTAEICHAAPGTLWDANLYESGTPCGPTDRVSAADAQAALSARQP